MSGRGRRAAALAAVLAVAALAAVLAVAGLVGAFHAAGLWSQGPRRPRKLVDVDEPISSR